MTEEQQRIAAQAVADVVRDAISERERPSAQELLEMAESAAKAIAAGLRELTAGA